MLETQYNMPYAANDGLVSIICDRRQLVRKAKVTSRGQTNHKNEIKSENPEASFKITYDKGDEPLYIDFVRIYVVPEKKPEVAQPKADEESKAAAAQNAKKSPAAQELKKQAPEEESKVEEGPVEVQKFRKDEEYYKTAIYNEPITIGSMTAVRSGWVNGATPKDFFHGITLEKFDGIEKGNVDEDFAFIFKQPGQSFLEFKYKVPLAETKLANLPCRY